MLFAAADLARGDFLDQGGGPAGDLGRRNVDINDARPEFVDVAPPGSGLLSANIERIDDLGRVRFARVRVGDAKFAARVPPGLSVPDNVAGLVFDPSHVHVYADSLLVEGTA